MSEWIFPICIDEKENYYYDVDGALETLGTIYQSQGIIRSIDVGDIVYIREFKSVNGKSVSFIGWKCKVLSVKATYDDTKEINDSKFEHGYSERSDYYIKITKLHKYDDDSRKKLSLDKLRRNGLKQERSPFRLDSPRVNPQLLKYINSIQTFGGLR